MHNKIITILTIAGAVLAFTANAHAPKEATKHTGKANHKHSMHKSKSDASANAAASNNKESETPRTIYGTDNTTTLEYPDSGYVLNPATGGYTYNPSAAHD